jgi:single-strand DNA-binding protein
MTQSNSTVLTGNVGGEPRLYQTPTGKIKITFSLATNTLSKDSEGHTQKEVHWVTVAIWGKRGERVLNDIQKGARVLVHGHMAAREYIAKDGITPRISEELVAEGFYILPASKSLAQQ